MDLSFHSRHIKMNGTPWHSKGLRAHFTAAVTAAAVALITATAVDYSLHNDLDRTIGRLPRDLVMCVFGAAAARFSIKRVEDNSRLKSDSVFDHPIDIEGRDFPPQNLPRLDSETRLLRAYHATVASAVTAIWACFAPYIDGSLALAVAPLVAENSTRAIRCHHLLTRRYIFSGMPPRETEHQRSTSTAAATQNTPA